jgi:hypothetical protein
MTSHRKRKKRAAARGLSDSELELVQILEEVLDALRWVQILGYSNQYVLEQELSVPADERDRVLEAATRSVDRDAKLHEWRARLARLKGELAGVRQAIAADLEETARNGSGEREGDAGPD